jgi:hypothetical protein
MDGSDYFVTLPFLPPTSNHIYSSRRGSSKRFKTDQAEAFLLKTVALIVSECQPKIARLNPKGLYRTYYRFFFLDDEILNTSFGKDTKKAAATRYKRMDVENRLKLVSDALSKAIDIDDCHFFEAGHSKNSATLVGGIPQVHIYLSEVEPWRFGL